MLDGLDHLDDVGRGQYLCGLPLDISDQSTVHDVVRHWRLESTVANKVNH